MVRPTWMAPCSHDPIHPTPAPGHRDRRGGHRGDGHRGDVAGVHLARPIGRASHRTGDGPAGSPRRRARRCLPTVRVSRPHRARPDRSPRRRLPRPRQPAPRLRVPPRDSWPRWTRALSGSARSTGCPASVPRSCSLTGRAGRGPRDWLTLLPVDRSPPTRPSRSRASRRPSRRRLILALIEDGRLSLEFDRSDVPAGPQDQPSDHRSGAARPHEWAARFLLQPDHRPRAPGQTGQGLGSGSLAPLSRQAVCQAGHVMALLEHELPDPGHARRGRRRGAGRRSAACPVLRPARARPHVLPVGRGAPRSGRQGLPVPGDGALPSGDRSVGWDGRRAVHLRGDGRRRRRFDRDRRHRPCSLGPSVVWR